MMTTRVIPVPHVPRLRNEITDIMHFLSTHLSLLHRLKQLLILRTDYELIKNVHRTPQVLFRTEACRSLLKHIVPLIN